MPEIARRLVTLREHEPRFALTIDRAAANADALEIPASAASDAIIDDPWNGPVQLAMDPAAVDLTEALARGVPVLTMHERALPVGRFVDPRIEGGRLLGTIRFSRSDLGRQLYQDCADGILTDTSVGAAISAVQEQPSHLVAIRWRPREISLVDRGADPAVGIARAAADAAAPSTSGVTSPMPEPTHPAADPAGSAGTAAPATGGGATSAETQRVTNIMELARYADTRAPELGLGKLADDYIQCGRPQEEYRAEVWRRLQERQAQQPGVTAPPTQTGMSQREAKQFSIVRASLAALTGDWKRAGFELECSRAIADRLNRPARGFFVPSEVQAHIGEQAMHVQRTAQSVGDPTYGGFVVPTNYRGDLFIESLRAQSVAMSLGVVSLPGLVGNVAIPKQTGSASFAWVPEGGAATDSAVTFGQVALSPRTIAGAVPMTRRLLQQSSPAIESLVRQDMVRGASLAIDLAVFEGLGASGQPLGVLNHASINTVSVSTDGTPTWEEVVQFETEVASDNALSGSLAYLTTPGVVGKMKVTAKATGQMGFVMSSDGTVNGYPCARSTQLTANTLAFGDWSQIIVAFWGVLDIQPDEATLASSGGLVLRVFQDADIAIRQPTAFAKGT